MKLKIAILFFLFMLPCFTFAQDIGIYINNEKLICDVPPVIVNDRTLVPVRAIFEAFDANCDWDDKNKAVTISGDSKILLHIGSNIAYVNNKEKELDCAPTILNSRTMVPIRFISETLNHDVRWDDVNRDVYISKKVEKAELTKISFSTDEAAAKIKLKFSDAISKHTEYALETPDRIVFEIESCESHDTETRIFDEYGIKQLRIGNHDEYLKLVFDMEKPKDYKFELSNDKKSATITIFDYTDEEKPDDEDEKDPEDTEEATSPETDEAHEYTVIIDAGHGGNDVGTLMRDANGEPYLFEKDINLKIANYCMEELRSQGIKVYATREDDDTLKLSDRTDLANEKKADLFVSIHVNYFENPAANGTLTLYSKSKDEKNPDDISSKKVAQIIQNKLYPAFGTSNAGIRSEDEMYVLRCSEMPAVLIETGFISNENDREILMDDDKLKAGAVAICEAISEIMKIDKEG